MTSFGGFLGQSWTLKFHIGKIAEISEFQLCPNIPLKTGHFFIMKNLWDLKKSLQ